MKIICQNGAAEKPILQSAAAPLPATGNLYGGPRIADLSVSSVWEVLGGPPSVRNRSVAWYRGGRGLNIQLYPNTGTWRDFKTGEGGGILALVERVLGCDRRGALEWLSDRFGIASGVRSLEERRDYSRRLAQARVAASELVERRDAYLMDLRTASGILLAEFHRLIRVGNASKAAEVWAKLDAIAGRRDQYKLATGPELQRLFAQFSEVAA